MGADCEPGALLSLLRLASPALPIGAYAGSEALEYAVDAGWVADEAAAGEWIGGRLSHSQTFVEVPLLARLYAAWEDDEPERLRQWSAFARASRGAAELWAQDHSLGTALARLLAQLGVEKAAPWVTRADCSYLTSFALAAQTWNIPLCAAATGYLFSWCESQVGAAIKLVPLGQSAGQKILGELMTRIPLCVEHGLACSDDEIGASEPGLAIASALHESQYTRLFRS